MANQSGSFNMSFGTSYDVCDEAGRDRGFVVDISTRSCAMMNTMAQRIGLRLKWSKLGVV
jgi:hypothetical protein